MSGAISAGTLATMAGIGAAGSIGGALIGSNAAGNAASTQANAANNAAQLQYQASQDALNFEKQQWNQTQANIGPWLNTGASALGNLSYLLGLTPSSTSGTMTGGGPTAYGGYQSSGDTSLPGSGINGSRPGVPGGIGPRPVALNTGATPSTSENPVGGGGNGLQTFGAYNPATSGTTNLGSTVNPNLGAFGQLMKAYPGGQFTAPTDITEQNDPGYQARLKLGTDALERSAAAKGNLLTGGTAQSLDQFAQDYASNEYNNVYNRAYQNYATNYNQYEQQQTNEYNRLAALAGVGQQSAQQLANSGQAASNNVSSNLLNTASNIGTQMNNAGAANASGIVGSANAWGGALNGTTGNLSQLLLLSQLYGNGGLNFNSGGYATTSGGTPYYGMA